MAVRTAAGRVKADGAGHQLLQGIHAHANALRTGGNIDRAGVPEARVIVHQRIVGGAHEGVDVHMPAVGIQRIAFDLTDLDAAIVDRCARADGAELIFGQREGPTRACPAAAAADPPAPRIRAAVRRRRDTSRCRRPDTRVFRPEMPLVPTRGVTIQKRVLAAQMRR